MSVFATDTGIRFSSVVKHEYHPEFSYCREVITINDSAATLKVGAVLGKVTSGGKYKLALSAAVDGSQTPDAVYIADIQGISRDLVLAAATDTKVLALVRGPAVLAGEALQLGTGITVAAVRAAFLAKAGSPMLVETAI
jgi:hypothetical protein